MKKITLLLSLLVISAGYSQTLLQGFESAGSINGAPFGGMPVPVVETGTGSNTSQVLKIVTNPTQQPWQGINLFLSPSTNLTVNKTLTIDVLSSTPITFLVKVTTGGAIAAAPVTHNGDGTWQTLSFTFNTSLDGQAANPSGTYSGFVIHPYWTNDGGTSFFPGGIPIPRPPRTFYVDNIREPAPAPQCSTALSSTSAICDTTGPGATDDTYTASVDFSNAANGNVYVVSTTSGTLGGDDPNVVASGTITVTGIAEGTDVTITVDDTADGGVCSLSEIVVSPECLPPPTCAELLLEDFDGTPPTISQGNNAPVPAIVNDPDPNKVGLGKDQVLQIATTAGGAPWQQTNLILQNDFIDLSGTDKTVSIDWYSENAFDAFIRVDAGVGDGPATTAKLHPGGGWQTLVFDFSTPAQTGNGFGVPTGVYGEIYFFNLYTIAANDFTGGPTGSTESETFVDNIYQGTVVKTAYTYNGSWLPSDPTGVTGCLDTFDIVSGNVNITTDTDIDTITIAPGASLTVDSGVTLTAGTVNLNSTSSTFSSLIVNGTVDGDVNYSRFTSVVGTNDLIASPVSGQAFGDFATANTNLAASGTLRAFAPYNTSAGAYQNYDTVLNAGTGISPGTGYRMATTDGSPLTFTGTVSDADVLDISITDAAAGNAWNLIGNPYPSYIDFATFFDLNKTEFETGAFQAIYGYNGTGWTVWNETTILDTDVTELITPGQGFFVKSKASGGLVDFTTAMRTFGTSDDFISGRSSNTLNVASSKLILSNTDQDAKTSIYFIEGKTRGLDSGFDAAAFRGSASDFSIFTNLVENNEGLDMDIQTLGYDDFNDVIIPLGIKALAGSALTIKLDENSNLPSNINVYLEDTVENTLTFLNTSTYSFVPTNDLVGAGRFFLNYSSSTLSLDADNALNQLLIYSNQNTKDITIKGVLNAATKADLYDLQGRVVMTHSLNQSDLTNTIDVSSLSTGVYIIKVSNKNNTKTQKLIIK